MCSVLDNLKRRGAVYERLGVSPVINGNGTQTILGGSIMEPEVTKAMTEAAQTMVRLEDLNESASKIISRHTGAEAGLVTAGAAAGMMLQAAACIAGSDPAEIRRLPDTRGLKSEVVLKRGHNPGFVQSWTQAGGELVWVGGQEEASRHDIEAAIGSQTAALAFVASRWHEDSFDGLDEMVGIAQEYQVPVIVDAAAMLPPPENLRRFIEHGADMVSFSGGKALRGPQSTGILCGRKELIKSASLNNSPNASIGRPAKVCKEEIVGLLVALERYVARDHMGDRQRWATECRTVLDAVVSLRGVSGKVLQDDWYRPVPEASIVLGPDWSGPDREEIVTRLATGSPPIMIEASRRSEEDLFVNPHGFLPGEADFVASRLREAMIGVT